MRRARRYISRPYAYGRRPSAIRSVLPWFLAVVGWAGVVVLSLGYVAPPFATGDQPVWETPPTDDGTSPPGSASSPPARSIDLIDESYPLAQVGEEGWDYHDVLVADLNGDGTDETVHVIAKVERFGPGPDDFAWDDGHLWQVYVEDAHGARTYLFSRWVQLGELRVAHLDHFVDPQFDGLAIIAFEGARLAVYRADYSGPGEFNIVELASVPILAEAQPVPPRRE